MIRLLIPTLILIIISCDNKPENEIVPLFSTSDIELFWDIFDSINPDFTEEAFKNDYVDKGSVGLKDYDELKNICPKLEATLNNPNYLNYYKSIRENTSDLSTEIAIIIQAYSTFENMYQEFSSTDVYFLVGSLSAAGKKTKNGLLIAIEFYTKSNESDINKLDDWYTDVLKTKAYIPSVVVHELVHYQQNPHPGNHQYYTLLEQSIMEGMADYISVQVIPDHPFFNQHLHDYADTIEAQIWSDFKTEMDQKYSETYNWLYNGTNSSRTQPADLAYYVGYKIVESYALQFSTMKEAIEAMLTTSNYNKIYELSKYDEKFQ